METRASPSATRSKPRIRKSIAHLPSPDFENAKENITIDVVGLPGSSAPEKPDVKRPRSKSIGPGGIDALKEDAGNRRKSAFHPQVKSILKVTRPLSPTKSIPPRASPRNTSPNKSKGGSPSKAKIQDMLIDTSTPTKSVLPISLDGVPDPFDGPREGPSPATQQDTTFPQEIRVALRSEEEQQAALRVKEQEERNDRLQARRKSLANRRVSFAPEATLHTWDVVELPEDSTTSSASTNATRRASALSAAARSPYPQPHSQEPSSDASEPPSTPPEQIEETVVTASPARQRDLHQKKRRRSSGIPPMNFNNPNDYSSSPSGDSITSEDVQAQESALVEGDSDSSDSNDNDLIDGEGIEVGTNSDGTTSQSILSARSSGSSSTESSGRLDAALQQAAQQAGTQGIDFDENGDLTMELADEEITAAFKPWMRKGKYTPKVLGDPSALLDQENLNPFSPAFKANTVSQVPANEEEQTMDFTQAVGRILPSKIASEGSPTNNRSRSVGRQGSAMNHRLSNSGAELEDDTMEFTTVVGGIQPTLPMSTNATSANRRRSAAPVRRTSEDASMLEDATMDLTMAIGGIQSMSPKLRQATDAASSADEDEELSMEFTSVVGGGIVGTCDQAKELQQNVMVNDTSANQPSLRGHARRSSAFSTVDKEDMDIAVAVGGILPDITEHTEPLEDQTPEMDITAAIGGILPESLTTDDKSQAKLMMEQETDAGQLTGFPVQNPGTAETPKLTSAGGRTIADRMSTIASETGSPSLNASQTRASSRKNIGSRLSTTPKQAARQASPIKKPLTPSKQLTPQPSRATTPGKTPPIKNVSMRIGSPKKLFKSEIKHAASTPQAAPTTALFQKDTTSSIPTPSIVLKPRRRRSSGLGVDKEGLGSPHIAALLDRRTPIGDSAQVFTPQGQAGRGVRFDNPRVMEQQLEQERAEETLRETGRGILEAEADEQDLDGKKDVTTTLKEKIGSLTPQKKRKLNGRKSLHVGAARGILGKRPAELDEDEDEDEDITPKRLKGREGSPVKNVRLPAPPSKNETSGRVTRSTRSSLGNSTGNVQMLTPKKTLSPEKNSRITTPNDLYRFRDPERQSNAVKPASSFNEKLHEQVWVKGDPINETEDRIHLQDFLNLTSIRFMELTTTKRRHTIAPNSMVEDSTKKASLSAKDAAESGAGRQLEDCVVAGACTVTMLELYQHSCRELKKYISEGRSIVREIEADTFEENPALFREYLAAAPDVRAIMDNQFKNVKTHARLLSKAMWYEWRMKLLEGLKEGLLRIGEDMDADAECLSQQEHLLEPILPPLIEEHERVEAECNLLQAHADELAGCDQQELQDARRELSAVDDDIAAKQRMIAELEQELQDTQQGIENVTEREQECAEEIKEADRVRQECRGWSTSEITALKGKVTALTHSHGWLITSASASTLAMTYLGTLSLYFTPSSFPTSIPSSPTANTATLSNAPISLTYIASSPLPTPLRFFLQIIRAHLQCLPQSLTPIPSLLGFISASWTTALNIAEEIRLLHLTHITHVQILSDEVLGVACTILVRQLKTKVNVAFEVTAEVGGEWMHGVQTRVQVGAKVVYGEGLNEGRMGEWLGERMEGGWGAGVRELEGRLRARGKKV